MQARQRAQGRVAAGTVSRRIRPARGRLVPRRDKRGLSATEVLLAADAVEAAPLAGAVRAVGGVVLGVYREPFAGGVVLLAALPVEAVQPTPFQRDLSPTHARRLAQRIEQAGAFLDPLIVVRGEKGALWTPNGRHRLAAARLLGLRQVTALVSGDEGLAFRILALNTEKAHNLRDRSLEVIRMARRLARRRPAAKESEFTAEFEAPELLTLGLLYEKSGRFGGGVYSPFLKKIDRFMDRTLPLALRQRADYAARLEGIDAQVRRLVEGLHQRGFKSPFLRSYVVAKINPVRFHRMKQGEKKPAMPIGAALTRMAAAAKRFDLDAVRAADLALVAAVAAADE